MLSVAAPALEESGLDLGVRVLGIDARLRFENRHPVAVKQQMERSVGYREVGRVVRELPRKESLKVHPDWWYCQGIEESYCFRS